MMARELLSRLRSHLQAGTDAPTFGSLDVKLKDHSCIATLYIYIGLGPTKNNVLSLVMIKEQAFLVTCCETALVLIAMSGEISAH